MLTYLWKSGRLLIRRMYGWIDCSQMRLKFARSVKNRPLRFSSPILSNRACARLDNLWSSCQKWCSFISNPVAVLGTFLGKLSYTRYISSVLAGIPRMVRALRAHYFFDGLLAWRFGIIDFDLTNGLCFVFRLLSREWFSCRSHCRLRHLQLMRIAI